MCGAIEGLRVNVKPERIARKGDGEKKNPAVSWRSRSRTEVLHDSLDEVG
jgi:hypothetical protein